jgi:hypothetical protein
MLLCYILDVYLLFFLFTPTSCRFIRWLLFQMFIYIYGEVYSIQHYVIKVCQWLVTGRWFSFNTPVSSTNKTDHHDITWNNRCWKLRQTQYHPPPPPPPPINMVYFYYSCTVIYKLKYVFSKISINFTLFEYIFTRCPTCTLMTIN